jgi:hypothetical protein
MSKKKEKDHGHEEKDCCYRSHRGPELCVAGARPIVRRAVSDQLYLLLQVWLIIVLTVVDGGQVLIQHPEWLQ